MNNIKELKQSGILRCDKCDFYEPNKSVRDGECRYMPPKVLELTSPKFPIVDNDHWCGCHSELVQELTFTQPKEPPTASIPEESKPVSSDEDDEIPF